MNIPSPIKARLLRQAVQIEALNEESQRQKRRIAELEEALAKTERLWRDMRFALGQRIAA
jgi:hypothetical protein